MLDPLPHALRRGHRRAGPLRRLGGWALLLLAASCSGEVPTGTSEPLRIADSGLPAATLDVPFEADVRPVGGLRPYSFTIEEGELPPGLGLQGGRILGTPSEVGSFEFTVSVSDASLSSTFRTFTLRVQELNPPQLTLQPPDTAVREPTTLRLRVEDAFAFRGAQLVVRWDAERFTLEPESVVASRDRFRLFHEAEKGLLRLDVVALGEALSGDAELARFTLDPAETAELGLQWQAKVAYADRQDTLEGSHGPGAEGAAARERRTDAPEEGDRDAPAPDGEDDDRAPEDDAAPADGEEAPQDDDTTNEDGGDAPMRDDADDEEDAP